MSTNNLGVFPNLSLPRFILNSPTLSILLPVTAGTITGYLSNRRADTKAQYKAMRQPKGAPPAWVFGPMWTVLYASMGLASHIAYRRDPLDLRNQTLYSIQLGLNLLWTPLFFGLGLVPESFVDILALDWTVLHLVRNWWGTGYAGMLMAPYAAWSLFATYLNGGIGVLNGPRLKKLDAKGKAKGGRGY